MQPTKRIVGKEQQMCYDKKSLFLNSNNLPNINSNLKLSIPSAIVYKD